MLTRRVLTASILFVLCGAIPAHGQDAPAIATAPAASGLPDINGGTVTPTIDPNTGAPSGDLLAPAATRPRAGVDVLVDRPSALAAMATRSPETDGGSPAPDGMGDLQARPSALAASPALPVTQPTSTPAVADATPDTLSRPRATVQATKSAQAPRAADTIEIFALGRAPAAPVRQDTAGPTIRSTPEPMPVLHSVLPTITVYAEPPVREPRVPAKELAVALPAVPLPTRPAGETGRLRLHFDAAIRVSSPRVALYHQMAVALAPSMSDRELPVVRLAVTRRRAPLPTIAIAVADLPITVGAPRVIAELSTHTPVRVATSSDALGEASLGRLAELTRAQPAGRALMASTNRAGLVPAWHADRTPPPASPDATTDDNSSSVDAVLAQVAVLERQVAVQRATNDRQAAQLAQQNARLRQERARLAQATRVAMEQYVATSPILQ